MEQRFFSMTPYTSDATFQAVHVDQRIREIGSLIIDMRTALTESYVDDDGNVYEHKIDRAAWDEYLMRIEDHLTVLFPGRIG